MPIRPQPPKSKSRGRRSAWQTVDRERREARENGEKNTRQAHEAQVSADLFVDCLEDLLAFPGLEVPSLGALQSWRSGFTSTGLNESSMAELPV